MRAITMRTLEHIEEKSAEDIITIDSFSVIALRILGAHGIMLSDGQNPVEIAAERKLLRMNLGNELPLQQLRELNDREFKMLHTTK